MGNYQKHATGKGGRRAHKKRDKAAKRKAKKGGGLLDPFGYMDMRGKSKKQLAARMGDKR